MLHIHARDSSCTARRPSLQEKLAQVGFCFRPNLSAHILTHILPTPPVSSSHPHSSLTDRESQYCSLMLALFWILFTEA